MKQDFVILPRDLVELALASLESEFGKHSKSALDIRAALEQPQEQEWKHRLGNLLAVIHGDGGHYIDAHGWDKAQVDAEEKIARIMTERSQPVEQEPFTVLVRKRSWLANQWEAAPRGFPDYGRSWADERVNVYTHPQPAQKPLTDDQVLKAVRHLYQSDLPIGMGFSDDLDVARAIEAAHNIKD